MDLDTIIERIGYLRNRAGLTQRALSVKIGKNPGYINRLEVMKDFTPTVTTLLDIIDVCGSTPEEFFYENFYQYKTDKQAFEFLKTLSETQKKAVMNLYAK